MKKKKILFVDHDPIITGSTVSMKYLVKQFADIGWEVIILSPKNHDKLKYFDEIDFTSLKLDKRLNLEMHFLNTTSLFSLRGLKLNISIFICFVRGLFYAFSKLNKIKPDLVYVNEYVLSQFAAVSKILKIPVVTHIRSPFLKGTFGFRRYLLSKLILNCNNLIFAITNQEAKQIYDRSEKNSAKVKVIYEFLNDNDFACYENISDLKKSLSIADNKIILLMLGGVEYIKGTYETIQAFSKVIEIIPEIYLIIAGAITDFTNYKNKCLDLINQNKLTNDIRILGLTSKIHELIACSDIIISSSIESHFSRPIIEGWAQRKPVISSDMLHAKEIINDGVDALLYKSDQIEELAENMLNLINQPSRRKALGEAGYNKARSLFASNKTIDVIIHYCSSFI